MKGQYEQQCNAAALKEMGVPVIKSLKLKHIEKIISWVNTSQQIPVDYSNDTEVIIDEIIKKYKSKKTAPVVEIGKKIDSYKKLKSKSFGKILEGLSKG